MYEGQDLVIVGFPSNQFHKLEPGGTGQEILQMIKYVRPGGGFEHKLTQIFEKAEVNGQNELPLYTFLKSSCSSTYTDYRPGLYYSPISARDVEWNFEKFLIGRDGRPYARHHPTAFNATDLIPDIDFLLAQTPY